jgi:hypothetical protein
MLKLTDLDLLFAAAGNSLGEHVANEQLVGSDRWHRRVTPKFIASYACSIGAWGRFTLKIHTQNQGATHA